MQIQHLINGAAVAERATTSRRVNPATQEVLAEVARGGATEVDAAVAAAKAAFPAWAGRPASERAATAAQARRSDRAHVPDLARTETQDTGQAIAQTGKQLRAALGRQLLLLRRNVRARRRPHLSDAHAPQLHAVPSGGRVRADFALECAVHDLDLEGRPGARVRQHRGAEDERAIAADGRAPRASWRSRRAFPPACSTSCTATAQEAGEPLCRHPDVRAISFTGSTVTGNRIVKAAGLKKFSHGTGRQEPVRRVRRMPICRGRSMPRFS